MVYVNASILSEALEVFYYDLIGKILHLRRWESSLRQECSANTSNSWLVVIEDQLHKHPKLLMILESISFSICFQLFMLTFRNTYRRVNLHWNFSTIFHSCSLKSTKMSHSIISKNLFSLTSCSDLTKKIRGHLLLSHCQKIPLPEKTNNF